MKLADGIIQVGGTFCRIKRIPPDADLGDDCVMLFDDPEKPFGLLPGSVAGKGRGNGPETGLNQPVFPFRGVFAANCSA